MLHLMLQPKFYLALLLLLVAIVACQSAPSPTPTVAPAPTEAPTDMPAATPTAEPTANDVAVVETETPTPEPEPEPTASDETTDETPLVELDPIDATAANLGIEDWRNPTDDDKRNIMNELYVARPSQALDVLQLAVATGDEQFIPVLIELFRAGQLGISPWGFSRDTVDALETLSGQTHAASWRDWIEWYGGTEIEPPDGFTEWKGRIFSEIDPRFAQFFANGDERILRVEEIQWGGVVLDGIPALDFVDQLPATDADYLVPEEPVFGLSINGDTRAYPLRFMDWHEMANDVVGGVPVSIAYCTLCGAAVAFDGRASNGDTYDFGSSGFLYRSNKLMYDRQTATLWNQLTGEPVMGELVGDIEPLTVLPIVLTTWAEWQAQHPDTTVLSQETGHNRDYRIGAAYANYFADVDTMFPVWQRSELLPTKSQVYALRVNGEPIAYPIDTLVDERVTNDTFAEQELVLVTGGDVVLVTGEGAASQFTYSSGAQVRAYERNGQTFVQGDDAQTLVDDLGTVWTVTEDALISADGEALPRLGGHLAYWFGWYAFFPNTAIYGGAN